MRTILFITLMLCVSTGSALTVANDGTTKFVVRIVLPTCNVDFDPLLALAPVPHATGTIEHPEIAVSVVCNTQGLQPWLRLTHSEPVVNFYKVRMQPNQLLLAFKEKQTQKYVMYNSTDSSVNDPSMIGMLGGQSHNYKVQLIPVTEVDSFEMVQAMDGTTYVGIELYYK
ncbi:MAG: hypothetical protein KH020_12150 [Clostridiales bacterium]|nr:hypothetical protein [Clostridiales bacterium]